MKGMLFGGIGVSMIFCSVLDNSFFLFVGGVLTAVYGLISWYNEGI